MPIMLVFSGSSESSKLFVECGQIEMCVSVFSFHLHHVNKHQLPSCFTFLVFFPLVFQEKDFFQGHGLSDRLYTDTSIRRSLIYDHSIILFLWRGWRENPTRKSFVFLQGTHTATMRKAPLQRTQRETMSIKDRTGVKETFFPSFRMFEIIQ